MRRAPGPLGWLILLELIGAGSYRAPWWRWWRRRVHPWTDVPRERDAGGPGAQYGAPIVAGMTFVSERESGSQGWISCASCSATMVAGWAEREPSPHLNDAHRIREGAGLPHSGGMSDADIARGLEAVYGTSGSTIAATKSAILAALAEGRGLLWFHTYGRLPSDLRRWSPSFTGGHCAAIVGRKSSSSELVGWWDPLATEGWSGEWVDIDVLLAADWGDPARSYIRSADSGGGGTVPDLAISSAIPAYVDIAEGKQLYDLDGSTRVKTSNPQPRTYSPFVSGSRRAVGITTGGVYQLLLANGADCTNVQSYCPPPPPASGYDEGYAQGAADQWVEWAEGLGIPERPTPPSAE